MRSVPSRRSSPRDLPEVLDHERRIFRLDVDAGADRAAADAEIAQIVGRLVNAPQPARRWSRRTR